MNPNDISPTFCILPWVHLSTRPNGHMRLCCTANASSADATNDKVHGGEIGILKEDDGIPSNLGHHDMLKSWNNKYMRSVRRLMIEGKIPHPCVKCFKEEDAGHSSKRMWETKLWSKTFPIDELIANTAEDGSIPEKIHYFDVRMGTKCDLKCIMCSPHDSSLWVPDWKILYPKIKGESLKELFSWTNEGKYDGASYSWHENNPTFWDQLYSQIPHTYQMYMAGGEALIIKEYEEMLDKIIEMGYAHQIVLRYNSNALTLSDRLMEKWKQFKRVRFNFSIDSIEDMNKYIRWPTKWSVVLKQLDRLDNSPDNVEIIIACSVQMLNMYYIPDFIKWKLSQGYKKINPWPLGGGLINCHFVYHPAFFNVKVFPQWFKDKIAEKYEEFYVWLAENYRDDESFINGISGWGLPRLKGFVSFMQSEDWSVRMPEFVEYINIVDKVRKTNFRKTFPEMEDLLNE